VRKLHAPSSGKRRTLPLLGFRRLNRLNKVEMGFRVGEIFDMFDLEAPIFVGVDVSYSDRFAGQIHPNCSLSIDSNLVQG